MYLKTILPSNIFIKLVKCENLIIQNYTHILTYNTCDVFILSYSKGLDVFVPKKFHSINRLIDIPKLVHYISSSIIINREPQFTIKFIVEDAGTNQLIKWEKTINQWNNDYQENKSKL